MPFTVNDTNADKQNGGNFLYKFLCRQNLKISSGRNLIRSTVEDNDSVSTLHIHCIDTRREEKPKETSTPLNFQQLAHEYFLCFSQSNFGSWEHYRRLTTAAWILGYSSNPNGREMLCTCPVFVKKRLCKHSLGFQIMRGDVVAPIQAKTVPLGQKRKRGRPKKASSALVRD